VYYHSGKAKVVADALSQKSHCNSLLENGFNLLYHVVLHNIMVSCSLESKIIELQKTDVGVFHIKRKMKEQETKHFSVDEKGVLWFKNRLVVPTDRELRNQILDEAHSSKLSIHLGSSKMYQDLKTIFVDQNKEGNCSLCC
jgi:phosphomannomutase